MTTRGGPIGDGYHHRSAFKRSNKPFKGRSKGKAERINRGKVDPTTTPSPSAVTPPPPSASSSTSSRVARLHRSRQLQQHRRAELVHQKRIGSQRGPPRTIALIPLNPAVDLSSLTLSLTSNADRHSTPSPGVHLLDWTSGGKTKRVVLYETPRDQHAVLDATKAADIVVFVVSPHAAAADAEGEGRGGGGGGEVKESPLSADASPHLFVDDFGRHALTLIKAQGLPSSIGLMQAPPSSMGMKAVGLYRKTATRFFHTAIGDECRVVGMDGGVDSVRRWLVEGRLKSLGWREDRSYLHGVGLAYEAERRVLRVRGWLRGQRGLDVNGLVHITGHGDYQLEKIEGRRERRPEVGAKAAGSRRGSRVDVMEVDEEVEEMKVDAEVGWDGGEVVLAASSEESRQSLVSLNAVDPLAHEQSLITDEELAGAHDDDDEDDDMGEDHNEADSASRPPSRQKRRHVPGETDHQRAWDEALGWEDEDGTASAAASTALASEATVAEKVKLERDEVDFPDEVNVPSGTLYKERFARYRGLKSLRDSEWDVKEGLPLPYSQIFTFADFKHSRAVARRDGRGKTEVDGWVAGERVHEVTLSLLDVDEGVAAALTKGTTPVVLFGLMAHEHKVSVTHCAMRRQAEWSAPIKGKDAVEVHCAFRRFTVRPIYSQQSSRPRALVERFFHPGRYTTASFYSRILYPPAPVLMFLPLPTTPTPAASTVNPVIATGSLTSVDPDRLLLKRVVLTGSPLSCSGREAVVHRMFETPQDVEWFKPVELWTKRGLVGHVKGSHGLHGRMECEFDGFIQQSDTVCMSLYKRQFCPFDAQHFGTH